MPWVTPAFSHGAVDRAGDVLRDADLETVKGWITFREEAEECINNWRSSHRYPLQVIKNVLKKRAHAIDPAAFVSSRTKRIPAIKAKLSRRVVGANPRLSQMQDIGGCRAVLRNVRRVNDLVAKFETDAKSASLGVKLDKPFDYISKPKRDGYRSHHLVFRYQSDVGKNTVYNGLRIEVQIRSVLQHQWATAVETVDFFTGQQLKSNVGDRAWKRFFALTSSAIALLENCPSVPGTPENPDELREALEVFEDQLDLLHSYSEVTEVVEQGHGNLFLLEIHSEPPELLITQFKHNEMFEADDAYLKAEKQVSDKPGSRVVLVSADSLSALRKAYPNYFLNVRDFVSTIDAFLRVGQSD